MFFRHVDLAPHPAFAHGFVERRDGFEDEALQALFHQCLMQARHQFAAAVQAHVLKQRLLPHCLFGRTRLVSVRIEQCAEFLRRGGDDARRSVSSVEQAADQTQLVYLVLGVEPFAIAVPLGCGKAVSAFPDPQGVLGKSGIAFDRGDAQLGFGVR